jgi:ankyrin repeat protein
MSRINKLSAIAVKLISLLTSSSIRRRRTMYVRTSNGSPKGIRGVMLNRWAVKMTIIMVAVIFSALSAEAEIFHVNPDSIPFASAVNYPVGDYPTSVFCADLNGDGHLDIAVANAQSDSVSILINNGDGTFQSKVDYEAGDGARSVFCSDLDGDSAIDLAVANEGSHNISILKNNGDGTFQTKVDYSTGAGPQSVFCADLDRDGDLDLAVPHTDHSTDSISILMNNGNGTFQPRFEYAAGNYPVSVFCADLDGDTALDLAVANCWSNNVSILKNNGDGTFYLDSNYQTGSASWSVFCADLDGDGDLDLAVENWGSSNVSILKNNGYGTFESKVDYATASQPRSVYCADLDKDSDLDLVVVTEANKVSILKNNGDGTFPIRVDYDIAGDAPCSIFSADLDGDGDLDLAVANALSDNVSVLLNLTADFFYIISDTVCLDPRLHRVTLVVKNLDTLKAMTISLHPEITCPGFTIDSVNFAGTRIENWESKTIVIGQDSLVLGLVANLGGGTPPLLPGEGTIAYLYYTIDCDTAHTGETCYFSLDTTTIQPENQHLLFVDTQNHEFIPYFELGTTTVNLYRPGDVNCNCEINIGDVVGIINYLFKNGTEPCPMDAGDVNGDCNVDVGDAVYMINYLFKGGPAPVCGCASNPLLAGCCGGGGPSFPKVAGIAQVGLVASEKSMNVNAQLPTEVAGVQLEFSYNPEQIQSIVPELTDRTKDMSLFFSAKDGILKVGIIDMTGQNLISAGDGALCRLNITGSDFSMLEIQKAIIVNEDATPFEVNILPKEEKQTSAPKEFELSQNIPNPFNPETQITYTLPHDSRVKLVVYNVAGQKVKTLVDEFETTGCKSVRWDGTDETAQKVSSGIYFYKLQAGNFTETKKMILMK